MENGLPDKLAIKPFFPGIQAKHQKNKSLNKLQMTTTTTTTIVKGFTYETLVEECPDFSTQFIHNLKKVFNSRHHSSLDILLFRKSWSMNMPWRIYHHLSWWVTKGPKRILIPSRSRISCRSISFYWIKKLTKPKRFISTKQIVTFYPSSFCPHFSFLRLYHQISRRIAGGEKWWR